MHCYTNSQTALQLWRKTFSHTSVQYCFCFFYQCSVTLRTPRWTSQCLMSFAKSTTLLDGMSCAHKLAHTVNCLSFTQAILVITQVPNISQGKHKHRYVQWKSLEQVATPDGKYIPDLEGFIILLVKVSSFSMHAIISVQVHKLEN